MLFKPQEVMIFRKCADRNSGAMIWVCMEDLETMDTPSGWIYLAGSRSPSWAKLSNEDIFNLLIRLEIELAQFSDIPLMRTRDQLEDRIIGYLDYRRESLRSLLRHR